MYWIRTRGSQGKMPTKELVKFLENTSNHTMYYSWFSITQFWDDLWNEHMASSQWSLSFSGFKQHQTPQLQNSLLFQVQKLRKKKKHQKKRG